MVTIHLKVSMCRDTIANSNITKVFVVNPCDSCNTDVDTPLNVIHVHVTQYYCVYRNCYGLSIYEVFHHFHFQFAAYWTNCDYKMVDKGVKLIFCTFRHYFFHLKKRNSLMVTHLNMKFGTVI